MSSSIDSNAALIYMNTLAISFQKIVRKGEKISDICINSIASPNTAFGHRPNPFTRAIRWIAHHVFHRKATFSVGNVRISVPTYDPKSNLIEIRQMFRAALRAEAQTKVSLEVAPDPRIEAIIRFALETDDLAEAKEGVSEQTCHQILNEYLSERIQNISSFQDLRILLDSAAWQQEEEPQKRICMTLLERKIDQLSITQDNLSEFCTVYSQLTPLLSKEVTSRLTSRVVLLLNLSINELHDPTKVIDTYKEMAPALIKAGMTFTIADFHPFVVKLSQLWMKWADEASESLDKEGPHNLITLQQMFEEKSLHLQSRFLSQQVLIDDLFYPCPEPLSSKVRASITAGMSRAHISLYGSASKILPQITKSISSDSQEELHEIEQFVKRILTDMRNLAEPPSTDRYIEATVSSINQRFEETLSEIALRKKALVEQAKQKQTEALIGPSQFSVQGGIYIHAPQASGPITVTISGTPLSSLPGGDEGKSSFPSLASPIGRALVRKVGEIGTRTVNSIQSAIVPALVALGAGVIGTVSFPAAIGMAGTTLATAAFSPLLHEISSATVHYIPVSKEIKAKLLPIASIATGISVLYLGYRVNSYLSSFSTSVISPVKPQLAPEKAEEGVPPQKVQPLSKAEPQGSSKEEGIASKEFAELYLHASIDEKKRLLQTITPPPPPPPSPPSKVSTQPTVGVLQPAPFNDTEEVTPPHNKKSSWFTAFKVNLASLGAFVAIGSTMYLSNIQRQTGYIILKGIETV